MQSHQSRQGAREAVSLRSERAPDRPTMWHQNPFLPLPHRSKQSHCRRTVRLHRLRMIRQETDCESTIQQLYSHAHGKIIANPGNRTSFTFGYSVSRLSPGSLILPDSIEVKSAVSGVDQPLRVGNLWKGEPVPTCARCIDGGLTSSPRSPQRPYLLLDLTPRN
jgi:hypothetical protein